MGTREVYDCQKQKWVPYVSDPDKCYQHLLDVRDGYAAPESQGRYMVGSGRKYRELKEMRQKNCCEPGHYSSPSFRNGKIGA